MFPTPQQRAELHAFFLEVCKLGIRLNLNRYQLGGAIAGMADILLTTDHPPAWYINFEESGAKQNGYKV
jgi:hypothetical protein